MRFLFDVGKLRLRTDVDRDIKAALENTPAIEGLFWGAWRAPVTAPKH